MHVLLVSHLFPPRHTAGTEVYTAELGARLVACGHRVTVFTTDKDVGREDLSLRRYEHREMQVVELTNNLYYTDFDQTWERPEIARLFAQQLDELEPDVVHVQHLMYLSVGCLEEARGRGLPLLFTLHDFWLECPRMGQLVHADGSICAQVDFARCGTCLPSFAWRQSAAARTTGKMLARVHALTRVDLGPLARGAARVARRGGAAPGAEGWQSPTPMEARRFQAFARSRSDALRERVISAVDRFLSPSDFLRERMIAWGVPAERIQQVATGVDRETFQPRARRAGARERFQVTFLGTLVPLKGAHVLVEAWGRLDAEARSRAELVLYGSDAHAAAYVDGLRAAAQEAGARLGGVLDREGVAAALARSDVVVVPSLWFENRPLVVLEALRARVPVLVSDLGGMAELVREGVSGWSFPVGDADALAERLAALVTDPGALDGLSFDVDDLLPSWDELTDAVLAHYTEVMEARR